MQVAGGGRQVTATHIDIDPAGQAPVLAAQHRRPGAHADIGHRAQGDLLAAGGQYRQLPEGLGTVAPFPWITQADGIARHTFDRLADRAATHRPGDHRLHIGDAQAVACRRQAIDPDIEIAAAGQAFGQGRGHAGHLLGDALDLVGDVIDIGQGSTGHLDPDRALDAGGEHVDTVANRRHPEVRQPRHLDRLIQGLDQFFRGHARPPLVTGLELDGGLEHLQRRRIGGGLRPPGLAEDMLDFRHAVNHPVGLLQQLRRLADRQAGQRRGHVEQVAFVQRRDELASQLAQRPEAGQEDHGRQRQGQFRPFQYRFQHGPISRDQPAIERVLLLGGNVPANPVAHQYRHQRHRQARRRRHRIGLGKRQRTEQPPFLGLQGEHRQERQGDDQQAEEQCRADLRRRLADHPPMGFALQLLAGVSHLPGLDMFMGVLDHHHGGIDHRADGNRNTAEGHDIGVDAFDAHDDKRHQHPQRQGDDRHQRGTQVPEKHQAHQRHHAELFQQLETQVVDRPVDQLRAIIGGHQLDTRRQAGAQVGETGLDRFEGLVGVLARTQDDDAPHRLAFTVEFGDSPAHFRAELDRRDLPEQRRHAGGRGLQRDIAKVIQGLQVPGGAHHVFALRQFQHRTTGFLVGIAQGLADLLLGDPVSHHLLRVEQHLVFLDHAADGGDFRHVGHGLEFVLEEPVLDPAQLRQVMLATAIHEGVLVDPADPGGIRPEGAGHPLGQASLGLVQVLQHPRAGPVQVGAVVENHIDEGVAKKRVTTHGLRPRHREHGTGQRVGDLVLDDLRCLPGKAGADDHLGIGKVRQRIQRGVAHRPDTPRHDEQGRQQHQEAIADGPVDQALDHFMPSIAFIDGVADVASCGSARPCRLASESSRNWPEVTTCCPSVRPSRTSMRPADSRPVRTCTGL